MLGFIFYHFSTPFDPSLWIKTGVEGSGYEDSAGGRQERISGSLVASGSNGKREIIYRLSQPLPVVPRGKREEN